MKPSNTGGDRIIMQGIHVELTDAMKQSILDKFGSLLDRNEHILRVNVRLHRNQSIGHDSHYTATGQIEISGPDLVASDEGTDAYAVLDGLAAKLDHLLERRHGKRKDHRNHPQEIELDAELPKVGELPE